MDGGNWDEKNRIHGDPLKQNEEFIKHHEEILLDEDVYCGETVEHIEKNCNCEVICNPHFKGIFSYEENRFYEDVQSVIKKINEEEIFREERKVRLAERKDNATKKLSIGLKRNCLNVNFLMVICSVLKNA